MKINKQLTIASNKVELVSDDVFLSRNWPGKARFMVQAKEQITGLVEYKAGFGHLGSLVTVFKGVVDSSIEVAPGKWQVIAREYTAVLDMHMPLALRHVDLTAVLAKISSITGIQFTTPDKDYSNTKIPYFYNAASGIHALQAISKAFSIPDYIWQQQGDGKCYVGSYADSFWQDKTLTMPVNHTKKVDGRAMQLMLIPSLRPGVSINGRRIEEVQHNGVQTTVRW